VAMMLAAMPTAPVTGPSMGGSVPLAWAIVVVSLGIAVWSAVAWARLRRDRRRDRGALAAAEQSTRSARDRLAEVSSMTGGLAHEIKNPLSTLVLNAQLLDEDLEEQVHDEETRRRLRRRVEGLVRETVRLRGILEDFLRYAGRMRLALQRHDVASLLSDLVDFFHPQCDQSAIVLRAEIPEGPIEAEVDEAHLKQAVLNLMLNAVQAMDGPGSAATPPKGELIVRLEADDAEVRIHVIDTGPGIPADRLEEIFRPYVSGKRGGSGLGLPTSRRIAEEHGGRLTVHSEPGRGSDFVIRIPRRRPTPTTTASALGSG